MQFTVDIDEDVRIECSEEGIGFTITEGEAESFANPIFPKTEYFIPPKSIRWISSRVGATVQIRTQNPTYLPKVVKESTGGGYLRLYTDYIHQVRQSGAPYRLLLGFPPGLGLGASLAHLMVNISIRNNLAAILVDLDPTGSTTLNVPGTVSAIRVDELVSMEEGFSPYVPLVFGSGPHAGGTRYTAACTNLARSLIGFFDIPMATAGFGGTIIMCPSTDPDVLAGVAMTYECTIIQLVGHKGTSQLVQETQRRVPIPVVELVNASHLNFQMPKNKIREYFFGARTPMLPVTIAVRKELLFFCSIDNETNTMQKVEDLTSNNLNRRLVALSHGQMEREVSIANLAGFMVIKNVTETHVMFLAPGQGPLASPFVILLDTVVPSQDLIP
eukprot:PhF_6_TR11044/c0_g1_i1/m.17918/K14399/CLP1, HERB; polyribonucleotide 5'-hydroxyl-kinase